MLITKIKRPWIKNQSHGNRYNPNPFYQTKSWKRARSLHLQGYTLVDGHTIPNTCCIECFKQTGQMIEPETKHVDHIQPISEGGSKTDGNNLQTLCDHHHAIKSAQEGNAKHKTK